MTRDEFADAVSAALRLSDFKERRSALEPLIGYIDASDLAGTGLPTTCSRCGAVGPNRYALVGVCAARGCEAMTQAEQDMDIPF